MTAKTSETPETDAAEREGNKQMTLLGNLRIVLDKARSLERRLYQQEMRAERNEARIAELEAALAKARDEALEEAALLQWQRTMARFGFDKTGDADAIRALKGTT